MLKAGLEFSTRLSLIAWEALGSSSRGNSTWAYGLGFSARNENTFRLGWERITPNAFGDEFIHQRPPASWPSACSSETSHKDVRLKESVSNVGLRATGVRLVRLVWVIRRG